MKNERDKHIERVHDMLDSIQFIQDILSRNSQGDFISKPEIRFSIIKLLQIIDEASNRTNKQLRVENEHIPWSKMIAFRNFSVHEYYDINTTLT